MDRARGHPTDQLRTLIRRPPMGLYSESFRFEGGGRGGGRSEIGLNRTGKSCRLRWVNYLHPGLKRGKMTPQEERLVLELHAKWGNRWSRIARKLPGRTDNEIKNYWRTHMRKKAQESKRAASPSSSSSNCCSSSSITTGTEMSSPFAEAGEAGFCDTGGLIDDKLQGADQRGYSMDDIWKDIDETTIVPVSDGLGCNFACLPMASPTWQYFPDTLWRMEDEEGRMFLPFENEPALLTG